MASTSIARSPNTCPTCRGSGEIHLCATWEQPEEWIPCEDCAATGVWQPELWTPDDDWIPEPQPTAEQQYTRHLVRAWLDAPTPEAARDVVIAMGRGC
jgi:hypothetical protein